MDFSQSLSSLRHCTSHANVGSTNQRGGSGFAGPNFKGAMQKIGAVTREIVKRTEKARGFEVL